MKQLELFPRKRGERQENIPRENAASLRVLKSSISPIVSRAQMATLLGLTHGGNRDVYDVLGYKKELIFNDMQARYDRDNIAARIVDAPASATWTAPPVITPRDGGDTKRAGKEFTEKWEEVVEKLEFFHKIERADKASGIGEFGVVMIGIRNSGAVENPISRGSLKVDDLLYLSIFSQKHSSIKKFTDDPANPRFGEPEQYQIETGKAVENFRSFDLTVHHSRVIHLAESLLEDEVFGLPRLQKVYNLFDDLAKVVGGSAEFFWRIADRGIHADIDPEMDLQDDDEAKLGEEVDKYIHGNSRWLQTRGVKVTNLGSDTADPRGPFSGIMALISGATGIPQRILTGSERGQLASSQDKSSWNEKISDRQRLYAEPFILRRFINRLQEWGVLPDIKYDVSWPVVWPQTEEERSVIAVRISSASRNHAQAVKIGGTIISAEEFREKFLDLEGEAELPEEIEREIEQGEEARDKALEEPEETEEKDEEEGESSDKAALPKEESSSSPSKSQKQKGTA